MFDSFFLSGAVPPNAMKGDYVPGLVLLSYVIAVLGSYTGLSMAVDVQNAQNPKSKNALHFGAAIALGLGIWSMHFIGMLAFRMDMPASYDIALTILSMAIAVVAAYGALYVTKTEKIRIWALLAGSCLLGLAICAMHYTGMEAMQMDADLYYIPWIFFLSVAIAFGASFATLVIIFLLCRQNIRSKKIWMIVAAFVMGFGICGMHYSGMAAAVIVPHGNHIHSAANNSYLPSMTVGAVTSALLALCFFRISRRLFLMLFGVTILTLPLVTIVYQSISVLNTQIEFTIKEQYGLKYHKALLEVFMNVQQLRGITFRARNGDKSAADQIELRKKNVRESFDAMDNINGSLGQILGVDESWKKSEKSIEGILNSKATRPPLDEFKDYSTSIRSLIDLLDDVGDSSNLTLDPSLDSNYLGDAMINVTPQMMETLGRIRGLTSGLLASGVPPRQWKQDRIHELEVLYYQLGYLNEDIKNSLLRAQNSDKENTKFADRYNKLVEPSLEKVETYFKDSVFGRSSGLTSSEFYQRVNSCIDNYKNLYDAVAAENLKLTNRRQNIYVLKKRLLILSSTMAFIGLAALFVFLYRVLIRTERAEEEATNSKKRVERDARIVKLLRSVATTANTVLDIEEAIAITLRLVCEFMKWPVGHAYTIDHQRNILQPTDLWYLENEKQHSRLRDATNITLFEFGMGLPGRVWKSLAPTWTADLSKDTTCSRGDLMRDLKVSSGFAFPVIRDGNLEFILEFFSQHITEPDEEFLGMTKDISDQLTRVIERTWAEKSLKRAKADAENANFVKSEFLANMSHELRTPLNSIIGLSRMIYEDKNLDEENREMIGTTYRSAENLLDIVNDILDLSKVEAGELVLEKITFSLQEVVDGVMETMLPLNSAKGLTLTCNVSDGRSPYLIGDPVRLARVMINLIGNAIKYTDKGSVAVDIGYKQNGGDHVILECKVTDTGIGIPPDKQKLIFEKFAQADSSITRKYGGTGLGLHITKKIVEKMEGEIGVISEEGKGSQFWFRIPFLTSEMRPKIDKGNFRREDVARLPEHQRKMADDVRILVAEDHPLNQVFMRKLLPRMSFYHFDIADNGQAALEILDNRSYDIILMDCHMPGISGYDATKEIREREKKTGKHTPIVAMTADAMVGTRERCLYAGMDDYISKPLNPDELRQILAHWVTFQDENEDHSAVSGDVEDPGAMVSVSGLREFADTEEELHRYIDTFLREADEDMETLRRNCLTGENMTWVGAAHKLKGSAAMLKADPLRKLCERAQMMKSAEAALREEIFKEIKTEYGKVKDSLMLIKSGKAAS